MHTVIMPGRGTKHIFVRIRVNHCCAFGLGKKAKLNNSTRSIGRRESSGASGAAPPLLHLLKCARAAGRLLPRNSGGLRLELVL